MVTFTVIAVLVTPPEAGVIETVEDLAPPPADPLQPATTMNTSMAAAIPSRVRNRRTEGSINSRAIATMMKSTCRNNAEGGAFKDSGGTRKAEAVMDPVALAPGAGAAFVVCTEHEVISVAGVQVKATGPVNPPNPVTFTVNGPVAPLATLMAEAEAEKSHAVPFSGTLLTLPPAWVIVSAPVTGPGVVFADGLKLTWTIQGTPPGAITIGKLPLLQELELSVNTPVPALIAEILSGKFPSLPIETGEGPLVVVS